MAFTIPGIRNRLPTVQRHSPTIILFAESRAIEAHAFTRTRFQRGRIPYTYTLLIRILSIDG